MPGSTVFDDGVRLTRLVQLRVPPDLRARMEAAATAEGLTLTEFARRAIAERVARHEAPPEQPDAPEPAPVEGPVEHAPSTTPQTSATRRNPTAWSTK